MSRGLESRVLTFQQGGGTAHGTPRHVVASKGFSQFRFPLRLQQILRAVQQAFYGGGLPSGELHR
jgi:hypothetical protein